jgi:hypothetical protein
VRALTTSPKSADPRGSFLECVFQLAFAPNTKAIVLPCRILDAIFPAHRKFPLGYVVVAHRG